MLVYRALFRLAEESSDSAGIIEFGQKYKDAAAQYDPSETDAGLLAKIALARADLSSDLPRAGAYAQQAYEATAAFQPWKTPRNSDPYWLGHYDQKQQERGYRTTRALALEARGWTLCAGGRCPEGEAPIREAVALERTERNLRHLASALEKLGRPSEAAEVSAQALRSVSRSVRRQSSSTMRISRDHTTRCAIRHAADTTAHSIGNQSPQRV